MITYIGGRGKIQQFSSYVTVGQLLIFLTSVSSLLIGRAKLGLIIEHYPSGC